MRFLIRSGFIISGILAFVFLFSSCGHETMEQEEAVAAITINQASVSLAAGETAQLSAVVQPSSATDQRIIWTSSNESVATVSQTGLVTAVGNGDAIITASAGEKSSTCHVTVYIQIQFDDAVFKAECLYHFDKDGDGELSTIEALEVTSIVINPGKGISSLKGIEFFANLDTLICCGNQLTSLDVSKNPALTGLLCYSNQLTSLDVSNNPALTKLNCGWNQLTSLDVSNNSALTRLDCQGNQLNSLDVSHNPALTGLNCCDNQLTSLDVSNNPALTELYCLDSQLTSLDVSHNPALTKLNCGWNQLTSLDVSNNPALTELYCERNQLTNLDVSHNPALTNLLCSSNNNLKEIWLSNGQTIPDFSFDSSIASIKRGHRVPEAVDLGLSVKWASCNLGASSPEEFGDYYAWGETSTLIDYSWNTYKWNNGSYSDNLIKYNTKSSYGTVDNKTTLELSDDAAHEKLGGNWRMPSDAEWTELREQCTWTWTTQNGINGYKVRSNTNGNIIFLPASGIRVYSTLYGTGSYGSYWSSSLKTDNPPLAWYVYIYSDYISRNYTGRCNGFSVRPVYGDYVADVPVMALGLNKNSLTLKEGLSETLVATVTPSNATDKTVTWSSSNTAVATVSSSGVVTAKAEGTATITAFASGKTASCTVTVTQPSSGPAAVDLGLSVKWASYNLGASSPEEYGDYYAWGETSTKNDYSWATYKWCNGPSTTLTKYNTKSNYGTVDNKTTLELSDDAAHVNWGGSWRMPRDAEWTELRTKCTWTWTTQNGKRGYKVTSKTNGNSIFLPAAGYRGDTDLYFVGSGGYYWSSSLDTVNPGSAWGVYFRSERVDRGSNYRYLGQSVRPVTQ